MHTETPSPKHIGKIVLKVTTDKPYATYPSADIYLHHHYETLDSDCVFGKITITGSVYDTHYEEASNMLEIIRGYRPHFVANNVELSMSNPTAFIDGYRNVYASSDVMLLCRLEDKERVYLRQPPQYSGLIAKLQQDIYNRLTTIWEQCDV
jgi:hypothetical protein